GTGTGGGWGGAVGGRVAGGRGAARRLLAAHFLHAGVPAARQRGDDGQAVDRDAVEAALVDLPREQRLPAHRFGFAVHDAAAGEDLGGTRFHVRAGDGPLAASEKRRRGQRRQRRGDDGSVHLRPAIRIITPGKNRTG